MLLIWCIFFFKQKTAYEMRNSDWSSDVCSSDLFGAATVMHRESPSPHVDIRVEDGHLLPLGELRLNMIHTPGHTRDSMCVHVEDRVFSGDTQIGRASCRERVCQYV